MTSTICPNSTGWRSSTLSELIYKELEPGKSVEGASWADRAAAEAEVGSVAAPPAGYAGASVRLTRKRNRGPPGKMNP